MYKLLAIIISVGFLSACSVGNKGTFGSFMRSLNTKTYGYSVTPDPTGFAPTDMIEVFDVRPGDCSRDQGWNDCTNDRERSELSERNKSTYPNSEHWYGWYIYFPDDYINISPAKVVFGQFYQTGAHPVWMFQHSRSGLFLDERAYGSSIGNYKLIDKKELRGKWHKIEVQVRWAKNKKGFFRVWVNGIQKVNLDGQTMNARTIYFKYGIYRRQLSRYEEEFNTTQVPGQKVYYANVKRGRSRDDLLP